MAPPCAVQRMGFLKLLALAAVIGLSHAQQTYYFSGAVEVWPAATYTPVPGTAAVPAQCPADHPLSCSAIGAPNYCCPTNNYCAWSNSQVACCPNGQTCTGSVGGVGGYKPTSWYQQTTWQPTTTWQPETTQWQPQTTWQNPPATVVVAGGGDVTTVYTTPHSSSGVFNGYCSTQFATGPNLPTSFQGDCGSILIMEPNEATQNRLSMLKLGLIVGGLQIFGSLLLIWR